MTAGLEHTGVRDHLDSEFGALLRLPKSALIESDMHGSGVRQVGAAYLEHQPWQGWPVGLETDEPVYEMFVLDETAGVTCVGFGAEVDAWTPMVHCVADTLFSQLGAAGLSVEGTIALTGSVTPVSEVSHNPHFDDNQFGADDNVGFVVIIGSHGGPRVTTGLLPLTTAPVAPTEIAVAGALGDAEEVDDWAPLAAATGTLGVHDCPADRMVVFPQFGQLHSGPLLSGQVSTGACRQLFVARGRAVVGS